VNSSNALSAAAELETRVSDLEQAVKMNEDNIIVLFSNAESDRKIANGNAEVINLALRRIDDLERRLGQ
jgi:hypothetical protein